MEQEKMFGDNEVKSINVKVRGNDFVLTIEEAKALKASLELLLGNDSPFTPFVPVYPYNPIHIIHILIILGISHIMM